MALAVAIRSHATRALKKREIRIIRLQNWHEIAERSEDRQSYAPAIPFCAPNSAT